MPNIPGVIETFEKLKGLHRRKNEDYAGDRGPFYNFEFADYFSSLFQNTRDKVYAVIVGIKLARLTIVLTKRPENESAEDTFDDTITYITIWKADYMLRNKRETLHNKVKAATVRETKPPEPYIAVPGEQ